MKTREKPAKSTRGRPFEPGNPGRPAGSRNRSARLAEALMEDGLQDIVRMTVEQARGGDLAAAKIVLDRMVPIRKGAIVAFNLPRIETADDVDRALAAVAGQMGDGTLSPDEAATIAGVVELRRRAIETNLTEKRLTEIEARLKETSR